MTKPKDEIKSTGFKGKLENLAKSLRFKANDKESPPKKEKELNLFSSHMKFKRGGTVEALDLDEPEETTPVHNRNNFAVSSIAKITLHKRVEKRKRGSEGPEALKRRVPTEEKESVIAEPESASNRFLGKTTKITEVKQKPYYDDFELEKLTKFTKKKRRRSLNYYDDTQSTESKISFLQKFVMKKFRDLRPLVRRKLRAYYDGLILRRSQLTEADQKRVKFIRDIKTSMKPKGYGPWDLLWEFKQERFKKESPYGDFASYRIRQVIVKGGDDLRQEMVAMQLIKKIRDYFLQDGAPLFIHVYDIIAIDNTSGALGSLTAHKSSSQTRSPLTASRKSTPATTCCRSTDSYGGSNSTMHRSASWRVWQLTRSSCMCCKSKIGSRR